MKLNAGITTLRTALRPYYEILKFLLVVALVHFAWKLSFSASADDSVITFLWFNLSQPFIWLANHLTAVTQFIINDIFGIETFRYNQQLYFENSPGISIVWACSGVKQYLMMLFVLIFAGGSLLKKLWYIPLSIAIIYLLNIARLVILTLVTRHNADWFDFTHKVIFRAVIYGGLFFMWWLWVEKLARKKNPKIEPL